MGWPFVGMPLMVLLGLRVRDGAIERTDGPYLEAKEWVAGFDFPDLDTDHELVALDDGDHYPVFGDRIVSDRGLDITVDRVNWFSTYRVHHRVSERFRRGRVFLLGDAAHIHSPVGGQGMNTGIGDAINLAWKLAAVVRNGACDALLDS